MLDDFSRYIFAWKLCATMRASDLTKTLAPSLLATTPYLLTLVVIVFAQSQAARVWHNACGASCNIQTGV